MQQTSQQEKLGKIIIVKEIKMYIYFVHIINKDINSHKGYKLVIYFFKYIHEGFILVTCGFIYSHVGFILVTCGFIYSHVGFIFVACGFIY